MDNEEMNKVTEEMVESAAEKISENVSEDTMNMRFDFTPEGWLKVVGASALGTVLVGGTVWLVKKGVKFVSKKINEFQENQAAKKEAKAKVVVMSERK